MDVQNDFLPGGALGVPEGDRVVPALNEYVHRFQKAGLPIILTRDWHPPKTKHFNTEGGLWPPHCVADTIGAAFSANLVFPDNAIVVSKGMDPNRDSYTAFDAEGPDGEPLEALLRKLDVQRLFIGGLATDYCVRFTSRDALKRGFRMSVLRDAVAGIDPKASRETLDEIVAEGGDMVDLETLRLEGP